MRFGSIHASTGIALLVLAGVAAAQPAASPKLVLSQPSWDFGQVWEEEIQNLVLTLKNEGGAELVITEVRTTCGCTVAQPEKRNLMPGESTTVKVHFDGRGKQGDVGSKVIITSNDPAQPETNFTIKGFVKRAVKRTPLGGLVIRTLDRSPGQTGAVRLENTLPEQMKLEVVSNSVPLVDIEIKEVAPGVAYDVVARTSKELKPGIIRGEVTVTTGLSREKSISVPVRIQVLDKVEPVPAAILLRPNDKPVERTVSLQYYGSGGFQEFRVTEVKVSHPDLAKVTLGPTKAPEAWMTQMKPPITATLDARVSLPEGARIPAGGIRLEFVTNDPDVPTVEVIATTDKSVFEKRMYGTVVGAH